MEAQAKVRSMTQRLGWTTKPASVRLMISTGRGAADATRGPGNRRPRTKMLSPR